MNDKDIKETKVTDSKTSDQKLRIPRSFLILGGTSILVMAGAVLSTVFFYLSLPNHRELDRAGTSIRHVPLPVPPNTFLPSGSGKTVAIVEKPDFSLRAGTLSRAKSGFDINLTLLAKNNGLDDTGLAFALVGTPRWVDANRNAGEGTASLSTGTVFRKGVPGSFTIHFSRMPTTPAIDIYIGLVGVRGIKGDKYLIHFSNLKTPSSPS
jgi:hypothetical protein